MTFKHPKLRRACIIIMLSSSSVLAQPSTPSSCGPASGVCTTVEVELDASRSSYSPSELLPKLDLKKRLSLGSQNRVGTSLTAYGGSHWRRTIAGADVSPFMIVTTNSTGVFIVTVEQQQGLLVTVHGRLSVVWADTMMHRSQNKRQQVIALVTKNAFHHNGLVPFLPIHFGSNMGMGSPHASWATRRPVIRYQQGPNRTPSHDLLTPQVLGRWPYRERSSECLSSGPTKVCPVDINSAGRWYLARLLAGLTSLCTIGGSCMCR